MVSISDLVNKISSKELKIIAQRPKNFQVSIVVIIIKKTVKI